MLSSLSFCDFKTSLAPGPGLKAGVGGGEARGRDPVKTLERGVTQRTKREGLGGWAARWGSLGQEISPGKLFNAGTS